MKKNLFLILIFSLFLFLVNCTTRFNPDYIISEHPIDIPTEIQSMFLNSNVPEIVYNHLSENIKTKFVGSAVITDENIFRHLVVHDIINSIKTRFRKFRLNKVDNKEIYYYSLNEFKYYFIYDFQNNKPLISNISYSGDDDIYNFFLNDYQTDFSSRSLDIIYINYLITQNFYLTKVLNNYKDIISEILFNNIEMKQNNLFNVDDSDLFLKDLFILYHYYNHNFQLEVLYQFLENNAHNTKFENEVNNFLNNIHKTNYYSNKDNFFALKLFYFYKTENYNLFNIFYYDFIKKYPDSFNTSFIDLMKKQDVF